MSLSREDLQAELARYAARDAELWKNVRKKEVRAELRAELARFATKEELHGVRDDLRTQMMILFEDLKSTMHTLFDGVTARLDAMAARIPPVLADHERRISGVETRVTVLQGSRQKKR